MIELDPKFQELMKSRKPNALYIHQFWTEG